MSKTPGMPQATQRRVECVPAARPFHVLIKPIGPVCNLRCAYCFYLEKEGLYPAGEKFRMPDDVLEELVRQYIQCQPREAAEVNFAWQGGEPTLRGMDFYRNALDLQHRHARPGLRITNSFQTNGVLVDDAWARFFHEHDFLVGLSVDGPEAIHDRYRLDVEGRGTFQRVMNGLDALKRHQAEFNTLTVIQSDNSEHPARVYDALKQMGSRFMQFIPIVEALGPEKVTDRSVRPRRWGTFLRGIFDRWIESEDVGTIFVQHFDMMLGIVMGYPSSLCVHAETCGRAVAIEHNGDLFSCDHFVHWKDHLGNIRETSLGEMVDGFRQTQFGNDKRDRLPGTCRKCRFLRYCGGGCPEHRIRTSPEGEPGLSYLCEGYRIFYEHTLPYFQAMAECLRRQMPARDFPRFMQGRRVLRQAGRVDRNAPCPCGSGRKYKRCCASKGLLP